MTINYTARDMATSRAALSQFIQQTAPDDWSDFFESNLGMALISLISYMADTASFGQDVAAGEVFLATARRMDSGIRFGRSVGYVPAASSAAEVSMTSVALPSQIAAAGALVSKGQTIAGLNGLTYELLEDVEIAATDTISRLRLSQGASHTETFGPTNQRNQEVITTVGPAEQDSWHVFVGNAGDPDNEWLPVDNVHLEDAATNTFNAYVDDAGLVHVLFGDGTAGAVPTSTITVIYRTTQGAAGNSPRNGIQGSVQATLLGPGGGVVSIEYRNSESAASGGSNPETVAQMRDRIPAFIQANSRAVTLADYDTLVTQVAGVELAFADLLTASFSGNVVKVHVWSSEDVTFVSTATQSSETAATTYRRYMTLPEDRTDDVQRFLLERTPIVAHTIVVRPTVAWVDIYLGQVVYDTTYDRATIRRLMTEAVVALFQDASGFAIRISDLFRAIDAVQGVEHFYIERILVEWPKEVPATGQVTFTADTNPTDGDLLVIGDGAVTCTFEFQSSGVPSDPDYIVVPVIAGNSTLTMINLIRRIVVHLSMQAVLDETAGDPTTLLTSNARGSRGNVAITTTGAAIAVSGMTGGDDQPATHGDDYRRTQDPVAAGVTDPWLPGPYCPAAPWADASVSLGYNYDPVDGETVTIGDGATTVIFEFRRTGSATPPNVKVDVVVGDQATTLGNLRTAILGTVLEVAEATVVMSPGPSVRLVATDGFVLTVATGNTNGGIVVRNDAWADGGQPSYGPLRDIVVESAKSRARYYDYTYRYNNEIRFDSGVGTLFTSVVAINLRRLVFDLVTQ